MHEIELLKKAKQYIKDESDNLYKKKNKSF